MMDDPLKHQGECCLVDRHRFLALADVRDLSSRAQRSGRITDLSLGEVPERMELILPLTISRG
jgi:hypothetical protein